MKISPLPQVKRGQYFSETTPCPSSGPLPCPTTPPGISSELLYNCLTDQCSSSTAYKSETKPMQLRSQHFPLWSNSVFLQAEVLPLKPPCHQQLLVGPHLNRSQVGGLIPAAVCCLCLYRVLKATRSRSALLVVGSLTRLGEEVV